MRMGGTTSSEDFDRNSALAIGLDQENRLLSSASIAWANHLTLLTISSAWRAPFSHCMISRLVYTCTIVRTVTTTVNQNMIQVFCAAKYSENASRARDRCMSFVLNQ